MTTPLKPTPIENPNLDELKKICQEYIDYVNSPDSYDNIDGDDLKHYIYETALQTIFGKKIFYYLNNKEKR